MLQGLQARFPRMAKPEDTTTAGRSAVAFQLFVVMRAAPDAAIYGGFLPLSALQFELTYQLTFTQEVVKRLPLQPKQINSLQKSGRKLIARQKACWKRVKSSSYIDPE